VRFGLKTALLCGFALAGLAAAGFLVLRSPAPTLLESANRAPGSGVPAPASSAQAESAATRCLPSGDGFFRARLDGALERRVDWGNEGTRCEGMPRPDGNGIRLSFRGATTGSDLLVVIGIAGLSESSSGRALAANVTIIEESSSRVFSTRGDDKCTVDELRQELMTPWRAKARTYRVTGRGFCMEPANAVGQRGTVLMSTFDFVGQVTYEDDAPAGKTEGHA
jgi:hypothetical protein